MSLKGHSVYRYCERGEERERDNQHPGLTLTLETPGSGVQETSWNFLSSVRLQFIGGEHTRQDTFGPGEGHSGCSIQRRERAEQIPDKEQLATNAKQLAQPKGHGAWKSTNYRI